MPEISGLHHIAVPRKDAVLSGERYERVFGFTRILVEEEEDCVTEVVLEHPQEFCCCPVASYRTDCRLTIQE